MAATSRSTPARSRSPPSTGSETILVDVLDDDLLEGDETFRVELSGPGGGATLGVDDTAAVTIGDDDEGGVVSIDPTSVDVDEDAGTVSLGVVRTGGTAENVTVEWSTVAGTATAGADYTTSGGTIDLAEGDTQTIVVPILDDGDDEADESFVVRLSGLAPSSGVVPAELLPVLGDDEAVVTVLDDDAVTPTTPTTQTPTTLGSTPSTVAAVGTGALARTGEDVLSSVWLALASVALGSAIVLAARRPPPAATARGTATSAAEVYWLCWWYSWVTASPVDQASDSSGRAR